MEEMNNFYLRVAAFVRNVFPKAKAVDHLIKLREEAEEAIKAPGDVTEFADCLLAVFGAAAKAGLTFTQLIATADIKLAINSVREWRKDANGSYQHIDFDNEKRLFDLLPNEILVIEGDAYLYDSAKWKQVGIAGEWFLLFKRITDGRQLNMRLNPYTAISRLKRRGDRWCFEKDLEGLKPRCVNL